jgi:glycogen(starch) synthase
MTTATLGGVWNYSVQLTHALSDHQIEVALATMGKPLSRDQRKELKTLSNVEVFESGFKLEWMENPWNEVARSGNWLLEIEQRTRPEVIHLNGFAHGALPFRSPKLVVGHSCVASRWKAVKREEAPGSWNQYREVVRAGLQAAHVVVAPSHAMLEQLKHYYGPLNGKVIYNGRDPAVFHHGRKEEIIFSTGKIWDEAKNISALAKIARDIPWTIYVAGDQRNPNGAQFQDKHLCSLGHLPTNLLSTWLAKSSIFCLPARYEPFGLSILEAGLAGCALVLGNIPSLREIWGGAALFVQPDDTHELRYALGRVTQNLFRRKELAAYAQCRAIQMTPKRMAEEYVSTYTEALQQFNPPSSPQTMSRQEALCAS